MFSPVISMLAERAKDVSSLLQSDVHTYINILHFFAKHTVLAEVIAYLFCGNLHSIYIAYSRKFVFLPLSFYFVGNYPWFVKALVSTYKFSKLIFIHFL